MIDLSAEEKSLSKIVQAIRSLIRGGSNVVGTITLTANAASTVVTKANSRAAINVSKDAKIFLTPESSQASAEIAAGGIWISVVGQGTFTIRHANNAQTGRVFGWEARGGG